MQNIIY